MLMIDLRLRFLQASNYVYDRNVLTTKPHVRSTFTHSILRITKST